jgi:hypothetical protein
MRVFGLRSNRYSCLAVAVLFLGGCATHSYTEASMTSDERLLREQSDDFVQENMFGGAATGAIFGCILGAVLGASLGSSGKDAAIGCGAGAGAGALIGGVDGYMQAKEAQYQANQVAMAQSVAADVRAQNQELQRAVDTAQRVVDNDRQRLAQLQSQVAAKQMTLEQARAEADVIRDNSAQIADILAAAREKRDNFIQARNDLATSDTYELDQEIDQLNHEIAKLEQQLASINTSLDLTGLG